MEVDPGGDKEEFGYIVSDDVSAKVIKTDLDIDSDNDNFLWNTTGLRVENDPKMDELEDAVESIIDISAATALIHGKGDKGRMVLIGNTALGYLETFMVGVRPFNHY